MRIYFDTCVIQRPLDDLSELRVRLEAEVVVTLLRLCESGEIRMLASGVHDAEVGVCPLPERRKHAEGVLALATYVPSGGVVLDRAERYRAVGIKPLDAIHLASAVEAGADVFCTTDDRLLRRGRETDTGETAVLSPLDLAGRLNQI